MNKVHRKPENCGAKSCECMISGHREAVTGHVVNSNEKKDGRLQKIKKTVYRTSAVCYTRPGMNRKHSVSYRKSSPYSGVGISDRLLICGDYVPTGIPAWETIKL